MIVGHAYPEPVLQFKPGYREVTEGPTGKILQVRKSVSIKFHPVRPGIPTNKIPTRAYSNGRLLSKIDTQIEAHRLGVSHKVLDQWILNHPQYGRQMIRVDDEENVEAMGDIGYGDGIAPNGDGSFTCLLCENKYLKDSRGLSGHIRSKAHQELLNERKKATVEAVAS